MSFPDVKTLLPHRFPLLLVDRITALTPGRSIQTEYYVDPKLPVFTGHFPGNPIFPGVYSIEAMTQTGVCLLLSSEENRHLTPLFLGVNNARFKETILPGDTLKITAEIQAVRRDKKIYTLKEEVFVRDRSAAVCEAVVILKDLSIQ
ncbi:MAG: 3-hydroxyacyl-ACP dehydratase FabZ [Eubacterium sp.]|nr:3-hydroxyacyl-ACP dehydratase FabZ [Eubacterium sp.]